MLAAKKLLLTAIGIALFGSPSPLHVRADTIIGTGWTGKGANNNWATSGNWDNTPPSTGGSGDRNLFYGQGYFNAGNNGFTASNNNLSSWAGYRINFQDISGQPDVSFNITGNSFTLFDFGGNFPKIENLSNVTQTFTLTSGNTITLSGNATGKTEINPINGDIVFTAGTKVQINSPLDIFGNFNKTVIFNDVVSGAHPVTLQQNSNVVLNAANTYTGNTNIKAGTVYVGANAPSGSAGALGNSSNAITLGDSSGTANASLFTNGAFTIGRAVEVRSGNTGTMTIGGNTAAASTYSGNINLGTASGTAKNVTLVASAGGSVNFSGVIDENTSVPASNVTVGSATQTGTVKLSNSANAYNGTTTILGGTLLVGANAPSGSAGALGNASSAVLLGDTSGSANASLLTDGALTVGRAITVQSGNTGTATIGGNTAAASTYSGNITLGTASGSAKSVTLVAAAGGSVEFSGFINENTSVPSNVTIGSATHTGTVKLSNNFNQYGGVTTVNNGAVLEVTRLTSGGSNSSIGNSSNAASNLLINGGTLRLASGGSGNTDRRFTFDANGATLEGNALYYFNSGASLVASGTGNRTLTLTGSVGGRLNTAIPNPSSGVTDVVKAGTGDWTLTPIANTYSGGTKLVDGGLALGDKTAVGTGTFTIGDTTTAPTTTLSVSAVTMSLTGADAIPNAVTVNRNFTVSGSDGIELSGSMNLSAANRTITVTNTGSTSISGVINNGALTKAGSGILTLTGANIYGGGTTISQGTLLANNTTGSATGSGAVIVAAGATLGGTGSVAGPITVNGNLSPGASIETLDGGAVTFGGTGSQFVYELNSNLALPVAADLMNAAGNLLINPGTVLNLTDLGSTMLSYGTKFTLINYSGSWLQPPGHPDPNHFLGLPNGSSFTVGQNQWNIRYDDTTGGSNFGGGSLGSGTSYVTITAVPEASAFVTMGLVMLCGVGAAWYGKRKGLALFKI